MNQSYDLPLSEESLEELNLDETQDNTNNNEDANKLDDFFGKEIDKNLYKNKFSRIVSMLNMTVEIECTISVVL